MDSPIVWAFAGSNLSAAEDHIYIQDFIPVRQHIPPVTVRFDDAAVADYFDACVDQGISLNRCGRLWLHTHLDADLTLNLLAAELSVSSKDAS